MRKSIIIAFIIFLAVTGWFLSGSISIGDEKISDESIIQNNSDLISDNDNVEKNNEIRVESQIIFSEEIIKSITLQGLTIQNLIITKEEK